MDNNFKINPENEKLISQLAGLVKKEKEKEAIGQMVAEAARDTDFKQLSKKAEAKTYKMRPGMRALSVAAAILITAIFVFVIYNQTNIFRQNDGGETLAGNTSGGHEKGIAAEESGETGLSFDEGEAYLRDEIEARSDAPIAGMPIEDAGPETESTASGGASSREVKPEPPPVVIASTESRDSETKKKNEEPQIIAQAERQSRNPGGAAVESREPVAPKTRRPSKPRQSNEIQMKQSYSNVEEEANEESEIAEFADDRGLERSIQPQSDKSVKPLAANSLMESFSINLAKNDYSADIKYRNFLNQAVKAAGYDIRSSKGSAKEIIITTKPKTGYSEIIRGNVRHYVVIKLDNNRKIILGNLIYAGGAGQVQTAPGKSIEDNFYNFLNNKLKEKFEAK